MGFLKKLFKQKEGGTMFGNLIRGVAKTYSGGLLGNGMMMKKGPSVADQVNAQMEANMANMPQAQAQNPTPASTVPNPLDPLSSKLNDFLSKSTKDVTIQGGIDKKTMIYIGSAIGVILGVVLLTRKK